MIPSAVLFSVPMSDGTISVLAFVTRARGSELPTGAAWEEPGVWVREPSDANVFAEISRAFASHSAAPVGYRQITGGDLPPRDFRDAWTDDGRQITYDMAKARAIQLTRVRAARDQKLSALDGEWMKATGQKDQAGADAIEAQRQVLRDLPAMLAIDRAATIGALKACWDPALDSATVATAAMEK